MKRILSFLLSVLVCWTMSAQGPSLYFQHFPGNNGIQPRIFYITQDREGFLWMGSSEGLLRFDGNTYKEVHHIAGMEVNQCNATSLLYLPENGDILLGAENGLQIYANDTGSLHQVESLSDKKIKDIFRFEDQIFIATNQGLFKWDNSAGDFLSYRSTDPQICPQLKNRYISCSAVIGDYLYVGTYDGVYRIDPDWQIQSMKLPILNRNGQNLVLKISADPEKEDLLWIGTEYGLVRWELKSGKSASFLHETPSKSFLIHGKELWIGTDNGLFIKKGNDSVVRIIHESDRISSLSNNVIWSLFEDPDGNIFIGTDRGLNVVRTQSPLLRYTIGTAQEEINSQCICTDAQHNLYLGGTDGLIRISAADGSLTRYSAATAHPGHRISHNKISQLHLTGNTLWVSNDGGIDRIDTRTGMVKHLKLEATGKDPDFSHWTYSTRIDQKGRLLAATYNGLLIIDPVKGGKEDFSTTDKALPYRHILQNQSIGKIEISETAICIMRTLDNQEVALLDPETASIDFILKGIKTYDIATDGKNFYIATAHGVIELHPDHSYHFIEGLNSPVKQLDVQNGSIVAFNSQNIFIHDQKGWKNWQNPESAITCIKAIDEKTAICGSIDCFYKLDYDQISRESRPGTPIITSLLVGNKELRPNTPYRHKVILPLPISQMETITLTPGMSTFSLDFSLPDYSNNKLNYAYRLKGFNEEWIYTTEKKANFINIPAGNYDFEVKMVLRGDTDESPVKKLSIKIPPMWYNTTWAYLLYVLVGLAVSAGIIHFLKIQHQLRKEHQEREKALESIEIKNRFLENISHEFKSPLSVIMGTVGKMTAHTSDAIYNKDVASLKNNAEKIYHLIDKIVEMNAKGTRQLFVPAATSLHDLVQKCYNDILPAFKEKNIYIQFMTEDIQYIFMLDQMKMESVITNLLSNALKFTPEGGHVLVSVRNAEETKEMVYAEISVEDNGVGIKDDELPHVFEHYYMADSNKGINPDGSGIGLYLCKQWVEMHNGQLSVKSEYGKGSKFTVRLSTLKAHSFLLSNNQEEDLSIHNLSSVWKHERRPNILITEDNDDIRNMIIESLGPDYNFFPAHNGLEGLEIMKSGKIDLVITDLMMPEMDGLELCRKIKSSLNTAFVPIIILTGKVNEKTRLKAYEFSDAFIPKPFNMNYLNSCIIQLLIKHEEYLQKLHQTQLLQPQVEQLDSQEERLMEEILDIINKHLNDPELTVAVLCKESHYSNKQIYRYLKENHGMTVVEFIRDIRLRKAAAYIEQDKLTISEIMYMVGFTTPSYFSKCFKEKFGVSPSEYKGN